MSSRSTFTKPFSSAPTSLPTPSSSSSRSNPCYNKLLESSSALSPFSPPCKSYTLEEELLAVKILSISFECFKDEDCRQQYLNQQIDYHPALDFYRELNKRETASFLAELKQKNTPSGTNEQDLKALKTVQLSFECYDNEDERQQYLQSQSDYNHSIRRYVNMTQICINNAFEELQQQLNSTSSRRTPLAVPVRDQVGFHGDNDDGDIQLIWTTAKKSSFLS